MNDGMHRRSARLGEAEVRDAWEQAAQQHCCGDGTVARDMSITRITHSAAYHVRPECDRRCLF